MSIAHTISRFHKERFLKSLSEDDFRDKVIRPLFHRLGFKDGRDLCGPQEAGKDAIFTEIDKLGITNIVAVQTKKGNLNLAAKASKNIIEAITQLRTALGSTVTMLAAKQNCTPNRVYLCSSGNINDAAKQHILSEVNNPNITFLEANDLIPKLDEHYPELWLGIDANIIPYFQALKKLVVGTSDQHSTVADISHGVLNGAASDELFVALNLHRSTARTKMLRGKVINEPYLEELPLTAITEKKHRRVLILGEAGSGKTTGLLRIAYTAAIDSISRDSMEYKIPVLIKSADLYRNKPTNFVEYCASICSSLVGDSKPCFGPVDLEKGRVTILLDSLDELPSNASREYVLSAVEDGLSLYPKVQVIATSRPEGFIRQLSALRTYVDYRINPISWKQADKIVRIVKRGERLSKAQSQEMLRKLEKLHGIELNPLLVTVFAATSDYAKQDIPANITELFKKFTELMLGRWDEAKGLAQQFQAHLKDFVLSKLAYEIHCRKSTLINREEARSIIVQELRKRGHEGEVEILLTEIFDRSGLFRSYENEIEFRHFLLQEFFAGRGIEDSAQAKLLVVDEWWKRALVFYFGENPQRIDQLQELMNASHGSQGGTLFTAATTIGLALQACYLAPVTDKLSVWKWVVEATSISREKWMAMVDPSGERPILTFVHYYLYARDSLALSNLKANADALSAWAIDSIQTVEQVDRDTRYFWLLAGLIESGELATASALLKRFTPKDKHLLLALHLACVLTEKVRPVGEEDKQIAVEMSNSLRDEVVFFQNALLKEVGSTLLELRHGGVKAIDSEAETTESNR